MVNSGNQTLSDFPLVLSQWHEFLNDDFRHYGKKILPKDVFAQSNKKVYWQCEIHSEHVWDAVISNRTTLGRGCPYCANQKVCSTNSLDNLHPELCKEWHPTKNGDMMPSEIVAKSAKYVWWKCDVADDHEWKTSPGKRITTGRGCPFCAGKKLSKTNRLSSIRPDISLDWNYEKNEKIPSEYHFGSNANVWWKCNKCSHQWSTTISNRTDKNSGCQSCLGMAVHSNGGNSLGDLSEIANIQWDKEKNGTSNPHQYRPSSSKRVWWICEVCNNEWQTSINSRFDRTGNCHKGCNVCSTKITAAKLRMSKEQLITKANEIHKGKYTYEWNDIEIHNQHQRVPITCSIHGEFIQVLATHIHGGSGCTICAKEEGWGGFNPSKIGFYYVNEVRNEQGDLIFYKAGISNQWESRLVQLQKNLPNNLKMTNLEVVEFSHGLQAQNLERELLQISKKEGWKAPTRDFDGGNELFLSNPLSYAKEFGLV